MPLPVADWLTALDGMEVGLAAAAEALDRHERTIVDWPAEPAMHDAGNLARLESRLDEWDARLAAAAGLVGTIKADLDAREGQLAAWHDRLAAWRVLIEQR